MFVYTERKFKFKNYIYIKYINDTSTINYAVNLKS